MNNKYTKIPCTLHWSVHYVDLKQNQKGNFEIEWARGSHKGQTDRIPCDNSNKVNYEANFEIPCTMFVHKDDQSIRNKQLKITLKRFVDNKLPKVYGKLTLDVGKYYQQQMEMQAASSGQPPKPIKEDIEMETGRSIAPVLNCTFNIEQVGKIEIGDVDQNDISYAGGTVDKMRVGLDDWDVTENEAALNEESSHHGKHSHGKKKDKSKKKSKKNKDKDKDKEKEAAEKTNNDNDNNNNAEKGELEDKYLSSSNEKLQAANATPNDEQKEKSQPVSNESVDKKANKDQKNEVNEKKESKTETDADNDKDQASVAKKEGENETDADKDQKTEKKKDKKKKKGKKKSKNDDKTKSENEEGTTTEDEQEKTEQKSDEEKADTKQSDEKKSKKKKSRKSDSGRKKSPKKSKNTDEDNTNQEDTAAAVATTERKIDIDEEEKEQKKEEREERKERKEENEKDKEEKVLIKEENEEKETLAKRQKEEAKEKAEKEAKEQQEKAEKEAKERAEKEAKEKADQEAKEKGEKEAKEQQEKAEKEAKEQQEKAEQEANAKAEKEKQDQQNTESNEKADQKAQSKSASVAEEEKESKSSKSDQESKEKEEEEEEEEAKEEKPKKSKKSKKRKSDSTNLNLSAASYSNSLSASNVSVQSAQPVIVDNPTPKQEIEAVTAKSWSISNVDGYIDDSDQFPFPACVFPFYATLLHTRSIFDYSKEAEKSNSSTNNERLELIDYFIECYEDAPLCERCTPQQNMLTSLLLVLLSENHKGIELLEKNAKQRKEMVLIDNSKYFSMKMGVYIEKAVDNFLSPILQKFEVTINRFITAKFEMDPLLSDFKHVFRTMENQLSFSKGINKMLMTLLLAKLEHRMIIKLISNPMRFMFNNAIVWNSFMSALLFDERIGLEILREVVFVLVMANGIADDPSLKNDIAPHIEPKVVLYIMKNYHPDIMLPQPIKVDNFVSHFFSCTKEEAFKEIETEKVPDVPCAVTLKTYKEDIKDGLNLDLWNKRAINDNSCQQYKWLMEFHK